MSGEARRSEIHKAERWAVMEWILVGSRLRLLALISIIVAIGLGVTLLYFDRVSHLSRPELRTFVRRQYEERAPRSVTGPLFGRLHESKER